MGHEIDMGGLNHKVTYKLTNYYNKLLIGTNNLKLTTYAPNANIPDLTLFENYSATGQGGITCYASVWIFQTFMPIQKHNLIKGYADIVKMSNNTSGNAIFSITNTSSGLPIGADLITATIICSALPLFSSINTFQEIVMPSIIPLSTSIEYAMLLKAPTIVTPSEGILWIRKTLDVYPRGNWGYSQNSGSIWTTASYDTRFQEWGYPIP
jgi:hypothetical protein